MKRAQILSDTMSRDKSPQQSFDERHAVQEVQNWTLKLQRETSLETLFSEVMAALETLTGSFAQRVQVFDLNIAGQKIVRYAGLPASAAERLETQAGGHTHLCGPAVTECRPSMTESIETSPLLNDNEDLRELKLSYGMRAAYCMPLMAADGRCIGVLTIFFRHEGLPDENVLFLSNIIAAQTAVLMERIQVAELLKVAERRATLGQVAIALAHEVNNPLQALTNLLVLLSHQVEQSVDVAERAAEALLQVNRINSLMTQMNELRPALQEDLQRTVGSMYKQ